MNYLFSLTLGYILGSFPSAYIILKIFNGLDITEVGTGNVGAMNALEISKSKILGILVLILDAFKGLLSVYLCFVFLPLNFIYPALALLSAIFSHCYNPWLKFKGGKGLASAAGGSALLFPALPVLWIILWAIGYVIKKDIIFSNVWASLISAALLFSSLDLFLKYTYPRPESFSTLVLFISALFMIILTRHFDQIIELFEKKNILGLKRKDDDK